MAVAVAALGCVLNSDMISLMSSLHGHRCKEALTSESLGAGEGAGGAVVVRQAGARLVCQKKIGHQTPARLVTDERPGKIARTVIVAARVEGLGNGLSEYRHNDNCLAWHQKSQ